MPGIGEKQLYLIETGIRKLVFQDFDGIVIADADIACI